MGDWFGIKWIAISALYANTVKPQGAAVGLGATADGQSKTWRRWEQNKKADILKSGRLKLNAESRQNAEALKKGG